MTNTASAPAPFTGFSRQTIEFLDGLRNNNHREWFTAHKADYERYIKQPSELFLQDMSTRLCDVFGVPFSGKIFRIHRDVRFSKDKTPYQSHIHMSFFPAADEKHDCGDKPALHFGLEPDQVVIGTGCFEFSKEVLERYRRDIASTERGLALMSILAPLLNQDGFRLEKPALQKVPRGFEPDHPRENLLRQKGLLVWHDSDPQDLSFSRVDVDVWMARYLKLKPIYDWLLALTTQNPD